jgi:hypothetical protein
MINNKKTLGTTTPIRNALRDTAHSQNVSKHMKRHLIIILIVFTFFKCFSQHQRNLTVQNLTLKDKDSISKMIHLLSGNWTCTNEAILDLEKRKIHHQPMRIVSIMLPEEIKNNEVFDNRLDISFIPIVEQIGIPLRADYKMTFQMKESYELLLEDYYITCYGQVFLGKKNKNFGFYCEDDMTEFIPIKFLDAKLLEFTDGKKFVKTK